MTNKGELTKRIAEVARGLCGKIDAMDDLMGTELYEYFTEMGELDYMLHDLLDAPPGDHSGDIIRDYTHGRIKYDDMLSRIEDAKATFNWDGYAEFLRMHEAEYEVKSI